MKENYFVIVILSMLLFCSSAYATDDMFEECIYPLGKLSPNESSLKVKVGDIAPDFTLPSINGETVTLSQYKGKKNVVISFVPAAWTPVCSAQWPEYNITDSVFFEYDAVLLGISVDNMPTLYAWTKQMGEGFWFAVLSDFWPHGEVASKYGILRSDGIAERALFIIDKKGIIRYIDVHDINSLPNFADLVMELQNLK
ncbi:MAG: peroxiredoxin [Candidatus Omnitrophota bacterium]